MMMTEYGSWSSTGKSWMPSRPISRKLSASAPRGAPPVHQKTAPERISSIPSVVMNDGTRRRVVISPLTRPTAAPIASSSAMTGHVLPGSPSISRAATTTTTVTSEPTDRSNSPETMTKYCPAARITSGAARFRNARKTGGSTKLGFTIVIQTSSTIRTRKIGAVPISALRSRSARLLAGASKRSAAAVLISFASPVRSGGRRRRRRR